MITIFMFHSIYIVKYYVKFSKNIFVCDLRNYVIVFFKRSRHFIRMRITSGQRPQHLLQTLPKEDQGSGRGQFTVSAQDCVQVLPSYSMSVSYDTVWPAYRDILERWCCTSMTLAMMEQENMWQWRPWNKRVEVTFTIPGWKRSKYSNHCTTTILSNTRGVVLNWVSKTANVPNKFWILKCPVFKTFFLLVMRTLEKTLKVH